MKDLIARSVEQGRNNPPSDPAPLRRRRSELPVARPATGRALPSLANVDVQRILDDEVEQAS